jgi:Dolichyl-phosphate-mannose-protein mannosyltransferase
MSPGIERSRARLRRGGRYDFGEGPHNRLRTHLISWRQGRLQRGVVWVVAAWAAAMYALMFLHPLADFPHGAPWSDMSKATDEGWYGGGALHHFVFGQWYLPESFNPTVAMPMWPLMLGGWFSLAGVGMLQARLLAVLLYGVSLTLMVKLLREERCAWLTCAGAVLLMTANPFCYVFDRMALLEPVSVFWWVLGVWIAGRAAGGGWWRAVATGLAIVALVLTKTTAVALVVSILYFTYARAREQGRPWVRQVLTAIATAVVVWCVYFFAWVRPRYLYDFKFVFAINNYRSHLTILPQTVWQMFVSGLWINSVLFPLGIAIVIVALIWMRSLWRKPLFAAVVLAATLDLAFIVYHGNFQPRYYLVITMPLVMVIAMGAEELWRVGMNRVVLAGGVVLLGTVLVMTAKTVEYVLHPVYAQRDMALAVAEKMRADKSVDAVLIGGAADDISLFTGVRGISFYEPYGLQPLLDRYQPRWMGAWLDWEEAYPRRVSGDYELQQVETFRVYEDQPHHQVFVLYRMVPRGGRSGGAAK